MSHPNAYGSRANRERRQQVAEANANQPQETCSDFRCAGYQKEHRKDRHHYAAPAA